MNLLKTSFKSKPIKGLTHVLGSKKISEMLNGIKIYDELSIGFDKNKGHRMGVYVPGWSGQYMKGNSRDLMDFWTVISANYSSNLDKWTLILKAVEIEKAEKTKAFLTEIGFSILKDWLNSKKSETWYSGHRFFQIGLSENMSQFCVWETQNDRTVEKKIEINNCA